jgi:hypothetical protein
MRAAIRGEGTPCPSFDQALHVQEIDEAADLSSQETRWMRPADL